LPEFQYTKPREEEIPPLSLAGFNNNLIGQANGGSFAPAGNFGAVPGLANDPTRRHPRKKKMSDEEVIDRLRTIVTIGDPNKKYTKLEKIGSG